MMRMFGVNVFVGGASRGSAHQLCIINELRGRRRGSGSVSREESEEWAQHGGNSSVYPGSYRLSIPLQSKLVIKFPRGVIMQTPASEERP